MALEDSRLYAKIAGGLLGGAVGDALGGPVEGLDFQEIERLHGRVDTLLEYGNEPSEHAQFTNHAGSYTDDTRLHLILCQAVLDAGGDVTRGDFAAAIADYRAAHDAPLARAFIEEYYLKGLYGGRKLIYGGQPTNGALMGNAVLGLIHPADPDAAFATAFELAYITDGYAKESSAMGAAAVAAAMAPDATVDAIVAGTLRAADRFRREGPLWQETVRTRAWARFEGRPNHELIGAALEVAERHRDVFAVREELYPRLRVGPLGSEAGQTLAVALAMLVAADGDYRQAVVGAVNYGRDNDSYAAVAGAIAGALQGEAAIPLAWRETVVGANPDPDLPSVALRLCDLVARRQRERRRIVDSVDGLLA